jgi:hypothetical protein
MLLLMLLPPLPLTLMMMLPLMLPEWCPAVLCCC